MTTWLIIALTAVGMLAAGGWTLALLIWRRGWHESAQENRLKALEKDSEDRKRLVQHIPRLIERMEGLIETMERHEALLTEVYGDLKSHYMPIPRCQDKYTALEERVSRLEDTENGD